MDQQILGGEQDFQMSIQNTTTDPKQLYFNKVVMLLQQIIVDEEFQSTQTQFMIQNCHCDIKNQSQIQQLFKMYKNKIGQLLIEKIKSQIHDFEFEGFCNELKNRLGQVDQQICEIVLSCVNIENFKTLLSDYKTSQEEEERYRVLTVKTNKLPENKKVKGNSQNIFGASNAPSFGSKPLTKKTSSKAAEKTLDQLLVPETVLTVKGLRKG